MLQRASFLRKKTMTCPFVLRSMSSRWWMEGFVFRLSYKSSKQLGKHSYHHNFFLTSDISYKNWFIKPCYETSWLHNYIFLYLYSNIYQCNWSSGWKKLKYSLLFSTKCVFLSNIFCIQLAVPTHRFTDCFYQKTAYL